jgi:hypothetical protein
VRRELSHLTDRELADIGITRSDIERIASGEARSQPVSRTGCYLSARWSIFCAPKRTLHRGECLRRTLKSLG